MFSAFQTFGRLGAGARAVAAAWTPLALWPDGIDSPGMWISPRDLTSQWAEYTGTTPVSVPGTVADSANPVGLALDIRAGNPPPLGPELVVNGDFSDGTTGFTAVAGSVLAVTAGVCRATVTPGTGDAGFTFNLNAVPVVGRTYELTFTVLNISGFSNWVFDGPLGSKTSSGTGVFTFKLVAVTTIPLMLLRSAGGGATGSYIEFDNISVKEVPGLHMLQSTSAARPLLSARVNLLTKTEDFADAVWNTAGTPPTLGTLVAAPDGTTTAQRVSFPGTSNDRLQQSTTSTTNGKRMSIYARSVSGGTSFRLWSGWDYVDVTLSPTWTRYQFDSAQIGHAFSFMLCLVDGAGVVDIWHPDLRPANLGADLPAYQRVNTATDYDSVGFPKYLKFDGVDDSMATAAFAAGTLIDGTDCMIAVRRDSAASCVAGLYNGVADATKFFGMAESASGSGCVGSGAGTPTVWVDNTQLTGGTAVTRGTLHTALTVGDWHILEFRNLDLSTWTAAGFGLYTSYLFPGPRGDILLYPSTTPTADKDAARQWLADYYGLTLP